MYILYLIYEIFIYNKYIFTFVCKCINPIGCFPLGTPDWYRWCHSSWSIRSDSHWAWQWPKEWFSPDHYLHPERSDVLSRASNRRYKKPSLRLTTTWPGYPGKYKHHVSSASLGANGTLRATEIFLPRHQSFGRKAKGVIMIGLELRSSLFRVNLSSQNLQ